LIHAFEALGVYMVLDVASGAVHAVDKPAYEALRRLEQGMTPEQTVEALCADMPRRDAEELMGEIDELRAQGLLFAEDDYAERFHNRQAPKVVKAMCLHAAHDCNLRCRYCFASTGDYHGPRGLLSLDTGKRALEFLVAHSGNRKNLELDFFGGEPMLNFEVVKQLVAYGRELEKDSGKRFRFTITTNGVGLTDEDAAFFSREMENVVVSLDGRKEVHDRMRPMADGSGSFEASLAGAKKVAASRPGRDWYVRGTFTANNLDFSEDVLALHDMGLEQLSIEPVVSDPDTKYALREEHLPQIFEQYEKLAREFYRRRKAGRRFIFFHFMVDLSQGPCIVKRLTGCGAGNEYVAVTPEGDIYPCHQFVGREGFKMGNVNEGTFDTAIQERFAKAHVLSKPTCKQCWARYYCSGGCAANAHSFSGDIIEPYKMGCEMEKKRLECALAIYALEKGLVSDEHLEERVD
jgi:uncharacterized protein